MAWTEPFEFEVGGDSLEGVLYRSGGPPAGMATTTGPPTSVKEQATGAYAAAMADAGFAALAYGHRGFGKSGGAPRQHETPPRRIEDLRAAMDALSAWLPNASPPSSRTPRGPHGDAAALTAGSSALP